MRLAMGISAGAFLLLASAAFADPVVFHPEGCDFALSFPAAPTVAQTKTQTNRGNDVVTDRASLNIAVDGKANYLRAECTRIPNMGFTDEDVLKDVMHGLGESYKMENVIVTLEHNGAVGAIGKLHGKGKVGGKDMTIEIRRFISKSDIFDVWTGAEPDVFPTAAGTAFLGSVTLNGQALK